MARNAAWRRTISDLVSWRQDQALNATIYILREMGPTGFLLKEEGESKKFKAFLGDPHKCTCSTFMKDKDLCKHICWLLLKKFRIPRTNPVTWQMGLVEREINELLRGLMAHQDPRRGPPAKKVTATTTVVDGRPVLEQREIGKEDVCPICQEELLAKHEPVTYCKFGCANSIHIKCMKVWAEHQKSSGETVIKCPFCREDFGPFDLLRQEYANSSVRQTRAERLDLHLGSVCGGCRVCPIQGKCYNCTVCVTYYLCQECFNTQIHTEHSFQFRQKPTQRWRPAQRGSGTALPSAVVNNLMNREIREEDYDMLLQLDSTAANQVSNIPEEVVKGFPTERVRDGSKLLAPGEQCRVCLRAFQAGQQIRRLPVCKHKFHIDCIDNWLIHQRPTCPIDGQVVWSPLMAEMEEQEKERKRQRKKEEANARAEQQEQQANGLVLEIPGVGLIRRGTTGSLGSLSTNKSSKPKTSAYNSIPLNFALTGTGLNSPQSEPSSPSSVSSPTQLLSRVRINRRLVPSDVRTQQVTPSVPSIPLPRNLNNNDVGAAAAISTNSPVNRGWRPSSITSSPGAGGRKPPSGRNSSGGVRNESGFDSDPESQRRSRMRQKAAAAAEKRARSSSTSGQSNRPDSGDSGQGHTADDTLGLYLGRVPSPHQDSSPLSKPRAPAGRLLPLSHDRAITHSTSRGQQGASEARTGQDLTDLYLGLDPPIVDSGSIANNIMSGLTVPKQRSNTKDKPRTVQTHEPDLAGLYLGLGPQTAAATDSETTTRGRLKRGGANTGPNPTNTRQPCIDTIELTGNSLSGLAIHDDT